MPKRIGKSDIIGEQGIAHIRKVVLDMGHLFYETGGVEAGIDGFIELRNDETGEVTNLLLQVQGKATAKEQLPAETMESFEWPCKEEDIAYWRQGTAPVLLIIVQTKFNRAYWKSIKDYFDDPKAIESRRVVFNKKVDSFDLAAKPAISTIAASVRPGAIAPPARISEQLVSNLLPVTFVSKRLFLAETDYRTNKEFGAALRDLVDDGHGEWIVKGGRILSFHDLDEHPWNRLCDVGTIESFPIEEWASSTDEDQQRDFVQLLNRSLSGMTGEALRFDREDKTHYFKCIPEKTRRIYYYRGFEKRTSRDVVRRYSKKQSPTETAYFRHSAFRARFHRFGDVWYLEVTPTYHFTRDGFREDRFAAEHLKKIKEFENNAAVVGQFAMWRHYLTRCHRGDMFSPEYPFLRFDVLEDFPIEQGVPDELWRSRESRQRAGLFGDDLIV
ncbi:DUF4365 domain-containing protein [Pelagibius sp. CAU 1746]|uniref:DUF4365 domain-containing protein n=1 Tax=Pelagibius sp. CAU 1746 TaxID=3140370 RepID=UPI00325A6808